MNPAYSPAGYGMHQQYRSGTPRTLGLLSIIFGSIVAVMSFFGLVAGTQVGGMMQTTASQKEYFDIYMEQTHTVAVAQSAIMLLMSIILIYVGTGQRKYMRWAVGATMKWSIAGLVYLLANAVVQFTVVMPALDRFVASISHGGLESLPMGGIMKFSALIGIAMYAAYPLVMIAAFRKPQNVASMDQPAIPTATALA